MPETQEQPQVDSPLTGSDSGYRQAAWLCVFLASLPIPLLYSVEVIHRGDHWRGYWGMGAALLLLWLAGHFACRRSKVFTHVMIAGGCLIAVFQFLPIAQLMAGLFGLAVARIPHFSEHPPTEWQGFVATFVTGGLLMAAAALIGAFLVAVANASKGWPKNV